MIRARWERINTAINALSLRERGLIFAAAAFLLVSILNWLLLDPLSAQEKRQSAQVTQQQEQIKSIDAQIEALLQAKHNIETSPQYQRLVQLKKQLAEGEALIEARTGQLVPAEKMGDLLEQVLRKNGRLELVRLQTLPVTPFIEQAAGAQGAASSARAVRGAQVFKHGVQITVRGSYADMTEYLAALERLPAQMLWGEAKLNVVKYPTVELTLIVYTLSLDKAWLRI